MRQLHALARFARTVELARAKRSECAYWVAVRRSDFAGGFVVAAGSGSRATRSRANGTAEA